MEVKGIAPRNQSLPAYILQLFSCDYIDINNMPDDQILGNKPVCA